tara:strand:+ start:2862 stop:3629 length:768 start_codon:yes stop_codon:yes gene_type:complete
MKRFPPAIAGHRRPRTLKPMTLAACLAVAAMLGGCDVADKIPLTPGEAARLAQKFGTPTRSELSGNDTEGRTYELMVESRREASWRDADFALWHAFRVTCPDGRRGTTISTSPADRAVADQTRMHPPGTVFRRVITCPPPPDFEFTLAEGLDRDDVHWLFHERLNEGNEGFPRDPVVQPVRFRPAQPKYQAIEQALGKSTLEWMEKCEGGASFSRVAVGIFPPLPANSELRYRPADAYIGFIVDCRKTEPEESQP